MCKLAVLTIEISLKDDESYPEIHAGDDIQVSAVSGSAYYSFTPDKSGGYVVYAYNYTGDSFVELYDQNPNESGGTVDSDDDSGGNRNFRLRHYFEAGTTGRGEPSFRWGSPRARRDSARINLVSPGLLHKNKRTFRFS